MERLKAYLLIGLSYVLGCAAGWFVFAAMVPASVYDPYRVVLGMLVADVAATVVVWLFGVIFRNSSFYDPYWSLIPWLIVLGVMIRFGAYGVTNIILLSVFGVWSWRLTFNWAYTCESLKTEDWRYTKLRADNKPVVWHLMNFFTVNMMPTMFVFLGTIPAILLVLENLAFEPLILIGAAVVLIGTALELFADISMHRFLKSNTEKGKVLNRGLWKYSRHPNYLGEISIWLGVYLMTVCLIPSYWYWFAGFLMMIVLFAFISIPMMEKRQLSRRPDYAAYQKTTSMLLILPNKKRKI